MADSEKPKRPPRKRVESLIASARAGSMAALGTLLDLYKPLLLSIANAEIDRDLRRKERGSDLVQRTLLEAFRDFRQFTSHDPDELIAWLTELLRNNIRDLRKAYRGTRRRQISRERSISSRTIVALLDAMATKRADLAEERELVREDIDRLRTVISRLERAERTLLGWRYMKKMTFVQIAAKLGKQPDAVRVACARLLKKLGKVMGKPNDESAG